MNFGDADSRHENGWNDSEHNPRPDLVQVDFARRGSMSAQQSRRAAVGVANFLRAALVGCGESSKDDAAHAAVEELLVWLRSCVRCGR